MAANASRIIPATKIPKIEDIQSIDDLKNLSEDSFLLWTQTSGAMADGNLIDFNKHRYLVPIYASVSQQLAIIKAAQTGLSVFGMLKIIYFLHKNKGRKGGYYGPTQDMIQNLSKDRLGPLLRSIPELEPFIDENQDKLGLRKIGDSSLYLFHLGGIASKDSVPLDSLVFDELRLMKDKDIDRTLERVSHSPFKEVLYISTAGLPGQNIDLRFKGGKQWTWVSNCRCTDGCDLAKTFPDCVVDDKTRGIIYLRCPKCKCVIKEPQNGRYICMNPKGDYDSFSVSQLASKYISLKEIWDFYHRTTNKSEFYNAKLGLPWVDEENRGVSIQQLKSCVDPMLEWAKPGANSLPTAMGVDVGGGYVYVTIMDIKDSKKRIRHVEIIETDNPQYMEAGKRVTPFKRLRQLIKEYNVQLTVVDAMPNYDMVLELVSDLPGKVFAAFYVKEAKDLVLWSDKPKTKITLKKAGPLLGKMKHYCAVSRYLAIDFALGEWSRGNVVCPDPDKLVQWVLDEKTKGLGLEAVMNRYFDMYTRLIKNYHVTNEETGEGRHQWIYSDKDPHAAHSLVYAMVALERLRRAVSFSFV